MKTDDRTEARSSDVSPTLRSALRWYLLGFAMLGGAVGFFAGASRTPVVGALLPILFGLVGGAGGLYLARAELSSPAGQLRLRTMGKAVTLFILLALVGSVYGISLRTGTPLSEFSPFRLLLRLGQLDLSDIAKQNPDRGARLLTLRARIRALGATIDEERFILGSTAKLMEDPEFRSNARYLNALMVNEFPAVGADRLISAIRGGAVESRRPAMAR